MILNLTKKVKSEIISDKFLKYFIVGLFAFAIDNIVLNVFKFYVFHDDGKLLGLIYTSKLISGTVGIIVSFYLNRHWSFGAGNGSAMRQGSKMAVVYVFNIFFGAVIYTIYFEVLGILPIVDFGNLSPTIANAATVGTQMFINFFLYKFIVFKI